MSRWGCFAVLLLLAGAAQGQSLPDTPATGAPQTRVLALETTVNGEKVGVWSFVDLQGVLYTTRDALDEWRVKLRPSAQPLVLRGSEYWPLPGVPGFSSKLSYSAQSVELTFSGESFEATNASGDREGRAALNPVLPSAFLNYDATLTTSAGGGQRTATLGTLVELGGSSSLGGITSTFAGRDLTNRTSSMRKWVRLETAYTRSMPEQNLLLQVGDAGTRPGMWGRTVYFGGVQLGTNYSLTPGFFTQPIPVISGVSSSPSTVELYINDVLRQVSKVPAGPFTFDNGLGLTGSGEARLVVRDILGREMITTQPFLSHSSLLTKGLADWGAEAGALRHDYGLDNASYAKGFASGTVRYGLTNDLTMEGRTEISRAVQAGGFGLITGLPWGVLGRSVVVYSRHEQVGGGAHWMLGLDKQFAAGSAIFQAEGSSRGFRTLGQDAASIPPRYQLAGNLAYTLSARTSIGMAIASAQPWGDRRVTTASAALSGRIGEKGSFNINASRLFGTQRGFSIGGSVAVLFDGIFTSSFNTQGGRLNAYISGSQPEVFGNKDLGWRMLAGTQGGVPHAEGGFYYRGPVADVNADVSASNGQATLRLGALGGMVFADGHFFVTRRVEQSYGIVEVKDVPDVGVGAGGHYGVRTDSRGVALVSNLSAWVPNRIRLNPQDLPVDVEVTSLEETVVPINRGAVKVTFPIRSGRSALITLHKEDGTPVPPGAEASVEGQTEPFLVARGGKTFATGLGDAFKMSVKWSDERCLATVVLPQRKKDDPMAIIGPVTCMEIKG